LRHRILSAMSFRDSLFTAGKESADGVAVLLRR